MKDNNENLNNELNDNEMEAVAGGERSEWSKSQQKVIFNLIKDFDNGCYLMDQILATYSPESYIDHVEKELAKEDVTKEVTQKFQEIKKALGIK